MLSYLAADVEISRPGLLANSTSRNGPNGPALVSQVAGSLRPPVPESQIAGFLMSHSLGHLPLEFPIMPHIMSWNRATV